MDGKRGTCCFCIELRTGSLIIGYLSLVATTILTVLSILGVLSLQTVLRAAHNLGLEQGGFKSVGNFAMIVVIVSLIFQILNFIFVIVLLVGIHKEKRRHVLAYLVYSSIFLVLNITMFIITILTGGTVGPIIRDLISIALGIWFIVVIRLYWKQMEDTPQRTATIYYTT